MKKLLKKIYKFILKNYIKANKFNGVTKNTNTAGFRNFVKNIKKTGK